LFAAPVFFLAIAAVSMIIGLFAERWLFFAEAKHAVSLYY
jgi:DMSO reductase anchor subunit